MFAQSAALLLFSSDTQPFFAICRLVRWRQLSEELHTGRTDHKQLIVSRGLDTVIWNQHWTASLPLSYPIILHSHTRLSENSVIGWEHTEEHVFYKSFWSWAGSTCYGGLEQQPSALKLEKFRRKDNNWCERKRNAPVFAVAYLYYLPSIPHLHSFIFSPSSRWLTAAWRVPSMLLSPHMSAQWNESPELTADGALWVDEPRSVCLVHSPRNLSSFFSALLSPKTTEGTLDHHLIYHHLPYVRGGVGEWGGDVSVLSLGLFIQGASGSSLTCSLDREPWGSS